MKGGCLWLKQTALLPTSDLHMCAALAPAAHVKATFQARANSVRQVNVPKRQVPILIYYVVSKKLVTHGLDRPGSRFHMSLQSSSESYSSYSGK